MKIAHFEQLSDNTFRAFRPINQDRMTVDIFKRVYGGQRATDDEARHCIGVPAGFSVWRTGRGELLAVRDE